MARVSARALVLLAIAARASGLVAPARPGRPTVFLTRESDKNPALRTELEARGLACAELPCIEHRLLAGAARLPALLADERWAWVLVTSPEAGALLVDAWREAARPPLRVATVGGGTSKVLAADSIAVAFEPSKATGKALAAELPMGEAGLPVLYPASARAPDTVAAGLGLRGFAVTRVDTYTTESPHWSDEMAASARGARYATFASPSALDTWAERAGTAAIAICIGETSGQRARELGFARVHYPEQPGLHNWAALIVEVVRADEP
jgi:uroporphyrinogen-III synthase